MRQTNTFKCKDPFAYLTFEVFKTLWDAIQIDGNRYDADMTDAGIQNILKFGIAFSGKKVSVKTK